MHPSGRLYIARTFHFDECDFPYESLFQPTTSPSFSNTYSPIPVLFNDSFFLNKVSHLTSSFPIQSISTNNNTTESSQFANNSTTPSSTDHNNTFDLDLIPHYHQTTSQTNLLDSVGHSNTIDSDPTPHHQYTSQPSLCHPISPSNSPITNPIIFAHHLIP